MNLSGKIALVAGIGDDQGYGWGIAKALAEAGATILVATWTPLWKIFTTNLESGKFDASRKLKNGSLMQFAAVYPLDASFDTPEQMPLEVKENKRYQNVPSSVVELRDRIEKDFGKIDYLVHSMGNAPEIKSPLLETSRAGYLAAMSASTYSLISLLAHLGPLMREGGAALTLSFLAGERVVPGYGGGMSSAKAALESDVRTLAWEAGRKWGIRVNAISAGPLGSRAAKAIGFIDRMIAYSEHNAPLRKPLTAIEVGVVAAFLLSPLASAMTGNLVYVDNGLNIMGIAMDSPSFLGEPLS